MTFTGAPPPLRRRGERGLRVAGLASLAPRLLGEPGELGANAVGAERGGLALVPLDLERAPPLHGVPVGIGDHRDAGGATCRPRAAPPGPGARLERHYGAHTRERLRLGPVVPLQHAAEHGTPLD